MDFSWGRAFQIAGIGFTGVFAILFILMIAVIITNKIVAKIPRKPEAAGKKRE